jgi:hypothetical protein
MMDILTTISMVMAEVFHRHTVVIMGMECRRVNLVTHMAPLDLVIIE